MNKTKEMNKTKDENKGVPVWNRTKEIAYRNDLFKKIEVKNTSTKKNDDTADVIKAIF